MLISPLTRPTQKNYFGKHLLYFPSRKNRRQVVCYGTLEADYCVHLEYDDTVESYVSQPQEMSLEVDGHHVSYTPDFRIETNESHYYTEVKVDFDSQTTKVRLKLEAAQRLLTEQGSELRYADAISIRPTSWLWNVKWIYYQSFGVGLDEYGLCLTWLKSLPLPMTLQQLLTHPAHTRERAIYKAIFNKALTFDLNNRLTLNSLIEKPAEKSRTN